MFAASPAPIMEVATGRLHNSGLAASGRPPTVMESNTCDGEAANIAKTLGHKTNTPKYAMWVLDPNQRDTLAADAAPMLQPAKNPRECGA